MEFLFALWLFLLKRNQSTKENTIILVVVSIDNSALDNQSAEFAAQFFVGSEI